MTEPGRLVARGRDGDIFELGPGRVLRRTRDGRSIEREALVMEHVRAHGYPVPEIFDVRAGGSEIVMERVDGPLMLDVMVPQIWRLRRCAAVLADLHDQLHAIPVPSGVALPELGGSALLHLDLHPLNVICSARGPVVIDWANAASGPPLADVACTYVLLTCPDVPGSWLTRALALPLRRVLADAFARRYRGPDLDEQLAAVAELKALDSNMTPSEVEAMQRLAGRARRRLGGAAG